MNTLDTRDLQDRLEELECALDDPDGLDEQEQAELEELTSLSEEISEWQDGATMIPEGDFKEYAMELATDTGAMTEEAFSQWSFTCIDWDDAANDLATDYTTVEYQGTSYYVRS
jgi:hypothetical protein